MSFWAKEKGQWSGTSKRRKAIHSKMKKEQIFGKQIFVGPCRKNGT